MSKEHQKGNRHSSDNTVEVATLIGLSQELMGWKKYEGALECLTRAVATGHPAAPLRSSLERLAKQVSKDGSILIPVPEGPFLMGSPAGDPVAEEDEKPQHTHHVSGFRMALHPVTNAQYRKFVDETGQPPPRSDHGVAIWERNEFPEGMANHPVVWVTWEDAHAYCEWAGLRLPTEAEWENTARGEDGQAYPWGNEWDPTRAACLENSSHRGTCSVWEHAEGASPYGLLDMAGNVWEWCRDWYDPDAYRRYKTGDISLPDRGTARVLRGGFWGDTEQSLRTAARGRYRPEGTNGLHGFRCAS